MKLNVRTSVTKSHSTTFAEDILKRYVGHIWAPNTEFLKHRHGHHSSTNTGDKLKHPEIEIFPPVCAAAPTVESPDSSYPILADKARDSIEL
jgi:hypothetical protein